MSIRRDHYRLELRRGRKDGGASAGYSSCTTAGDRPGVRASPALSPAPAGGCASDAVRMTGATHSAQPSSYLSAHCSTVPHNHNSPSIDFFLDSADAAARGLFGSVEPCVMSTCAVAAGRSCPICADPVGGPRPAWGIGRALRELEAALEPSRSRSVPDRTGHCANSWCSTKSPITCAFLADPRTVRFSSRRFVELASLVMGAEVGHVLRVVYARKVCADPRDEDRRYGGGMSIGPDDWQPVDELLDRLLLEEDRALSAALADSVPRDCSAIEVSAQTGSCRIC